MTSAVVDDVLPNKRYLSNHRVRVLVTGAMIIHAITHLVIWLLHDGTVLGPDSGQYWQLGKQVASGDIWMQSPLQVQRTPLYPWLIGASQYMFGENAVFAIACLQHLMGICCTALTMHICWLLTSSLRLVVFSCLISSVWITRQWLDNQVMAESLFTFLLVAMVYSCCRWMLEQKARWSISIGIALGLAILTRPIAQYLLVIFFCGYLLIAIVKLCALRTALLAGLLTSVFAILTISPWLIRNYQHSGEIAICHFSGRPLWLSVFSHKDLGVGHDGAGLPIPWGQMDSKLEADLRSVEANGVDLYHVTRTFDALIQLGYGEQELDGQMRDLAVMGIKDAPFEFTSSVIRRFFTFWIITRTNERLEKRRHEMPNELRQIPKYAYITYASVIQPWENALVAIAFLSGTILLIVKADTHVRLIALFLLVLVTYFGLVTSVGGRPLYRYRMILEPLICIGFTIAIHTLFRQKTEASQAG